MVDGPMKNLRIIFLALALVGCTTPSQPKPLPTTQATSSQPTTYQVTLSAHPLEPADPRDPQPLPDAIVHLDVYQFDVPLGTISQNDDFWKHVDEHAMRVNAADVLYRNGVRCGVAPKSQWPFFRDLFAAMPTAVVKETINGFNAKAVELDLTKNVQSEDLFFFNSANVLEGRSYESCANLVFLSFQPAPEKPGAVRLALTPAVRALRRRLDFTSMNQEYENPYADIDRLYDLNLTVDLANENFLVIAPSEDAKRTTSIGGQFFVKNDKAERLEQVLVIVPAYLRLNGTSVTLSDTVSRSPKP
jgi:hypothetical protein